MSTANGNRRRVALSGVGGLVGGALCEKLAPDYSIARLSRPKSNSDDFESVQDEIEWIPPQGVVAPESLEGIYGVVHLAGRSIASARWSDEEKKRIRESRGNATRKLVSQICQLKRPPEVFVCASAIGIYGDSGTMPVDEFSPLADSFLASVAKEWEEACYPLREVGVRVCHARLGIVLDKHGGALGKVLPLFRWMLGGRVGDGTQYWSWVALEDCINALQWMLETSSASGAYNVTAPNPVTNRQFTEELSSALGKPAFLPVPKFALRLAMGEMADALLLASCHAVPRRLLEAGFDFAQPDLSQFFESEFR